MYEPLVHQEEDWEKQEPKEKPSNKKQGGAFITDTENKSLRCVYLAFWFEYLSTVPFYYIGWKELWPASYVGQLVFLVFSSVFQYMIYDDAGKKGAGYLPGLGRKTFHELHERGQKELDKIMFILPVRMMGIRVKAWQWACVSLSLNYVHVPSTSVAVGASWNTWTEHLAHKFAAWWAQVPLVGSAISTLGLPGCLTVLLVWSCILHFICASLAFWSEPHFGSVCEASNLLFLAEFDKHLQSGIEVQPVRMLVAPLTKLPMMWMKTSLLAVSYDDMGWMERFSMITAILLGWYAFVPLAPGILLATKRVPEFAKDAYEKNHQCL